ncbi:MAG: methyl-accepting chemotaxis protein [Gallionellaceae bacterium]|nr:methyl-accepting chemotaxis protein [Gallionellaceae bacterium]
MKAWLRSLSIKWRLIAIFVQIILVIVIVGSTGILGMKHANEGLENVVNGRVLPFSHLKNVADAYAVAIIDATNKANAGVFTAEEASKSIADARQTIKDSWGLYIAGKISADDKPLIEQATPLFAAADVETEKVQTALQGKSGKVEGQLQGNIAPLYAAIDPISNHLSTLLIIQLSYARAEYNVAAADYDHQHLVAWVIGGVGTALALLFVVLLLRSIVRPLQRLSGEIDAITAGNAGIDVVVDRHDEIGAVAESFKRLRDKLRQDVAAAEASAQEGQRIRFALDNVDSNVMMADNERHIIYVNKATQNLFKRAAADIRKQLPHFDPDKLLGSSIDSYHKNPSHQAGMLSTLGGTHKGTLMIGGRTMTVVANPVIDDSGQRLGSIVQWGDRTNEVAAEREIANLVEAASFGDFSQRLSKTGKEGFFLQLSEGINHLLETTEHGINDVARVLRALSQGDLSQRIDSDYQGMFGELKDATNATSSHLSEIVSQIREATNAINTAAREIASGNADLSGRTEAQASNLEETASSMEEFTSTVRQNADNARQANQLAKGASDIAVKGGSVVGEVVHTMGAIADSSKKIADIISVIDGIAFQTNILALNAAVEAARAGEQGRGFAVVAGEVRSLAQRSAGAAKEIKTLIGDSVDKVNIGYKQVEQAGHTMDEIVDAVKRVTDIMGEISAASGEQSQGIQQVNNAIGQMDAATQQNAALVEEAAAAAETLQDQAAALSQAVAVFKVGSQRGAPGKPMAGVAQVKPRSAGARALPAAQKSLAGPRVANTVASDVDFDAIIDAHQAWKQKLRSAIGGGEERNLNPDDVCKDNQCALGKWIYGAGKEFAHVPEYEPLRLTHADFHVCAADILRHAQTGDKDGANAMLVGDFFDLSNRTVQHIVAMKRHHSH